MKTLLFRGLIFVVLAMFMGTNFVAADGSGPFGPNDYACTDAGDFGGTCFYDPNSICNNTTSTAGAATGNGKTAWNSSAVPPYYLEELVINILQDLAQTLNVPQSSTVTQQHVLAMIAWAQAEGGNIANSNAFNIWNMGFLSSNPNLYVGGSGAGDGSSDSFVSFNAAVQAFTIEFTSSYQSRIGAILSQQNSTAEQIFNAIAYPQSTPGNQVWATADPASYVNSMEGGLSAAKQNYAQLAGVVIGPGEESMHHVPASELQFNGGSGPANPVASSDSTCSCSAESTTPAASTNNQSSGSSSSAPTIVLDPGHATKANEEVDPATDEPVFDYSNPIEQLQVWNMANDLKTKLTAAGYNVLITKTSEDDTNTNLKERAEVGNNANAALGVSLHTTPGNPTTVGNDVFNPVVGEYLVKVNGQHDVYTNSSLASTDQTDAQTMAGTLDKAEPGVHFRSGGYAQLYGPITRTQDGITMQGTMLVTQYFATVPWVYVEQYQDLGNGRTSQKAMQDYETGVLNGIEKIVPVASAGSNNANAVNAPAGGCSSQGPCTTVLGDAKILCSADHYEGIYYEYGGGHQGYTAFKQGCPDPSNPPDNQPNGGPVNGDPAGLSGNPSPCGLDCSGFVSVSVDDAFGLNYMWTVSSGGVMQGDSGASYWQKLPSVSQAQPGDIVTLKDDTGHVEIVDHVSGSTIYTIGAHQTGTKISLLPSSFTNWTGGAWRWTGPGSK